MPKEENKGDPTKIWDSTWKIFFNHLLWLFLSCIHPQTTVDRASTGKFHRTRHWFPYPQNPHVCLPKEQKDQAKSPSQQ